MSLKYSQINGFLETLKQKVMVNNRQNNIDKFHVARISLLSALVISDFACLG
jgi:hypothetical protein